MPGVITDDGKNEVAALLIGDLDEIAVGTGSSTPSPSDTALENEVYRSQKTDSNVSITTTNSVGRIVGTITVNGGTEVSAGTEIQEMGIFEEDGGDLIYRESIAGVTVESGETVTFELVVDIVSA